MPSPKLSFRHLNSAGEKKEFTEKQLKFTEAMAAALEESLEQFLEFSGPVHFWEIWANGALCYEAWFTVDNGGIFEAGTTNLVAEVIQFGLETHNDDDESLDRALRDALNEVPEEKKTMISFVNRDSEPDPNS